MPEPNVEMLITPTLVANTDRVVRREDEQAQEAETAGVGADEYRTRLLGIVC